MKGCKQIFPREGTRQIPPGGLPIMGYTGMLCPKGVHFWAPSMEKGSLFQAGGM